MLRDSGKPGNSQRHQSDATNLSAAVTRWLRIMARHLGRLFEMFLKLGILAGLWSFRGERGTGIGRRKWRRGAWQSTSFISGDVVAATAA